MQLSPSLRPLAFLALLLLPSTPGGAQTLLLHYPFDQADTGGTQAVDASGSRRDGEFRNAAGVAAPLQTGAGVSGQNGDSAFDNSSSASGTTGMGDKNSGGVVTSLLDDTNSFPALTSFTVTAWLKPSDRWTNIGTILQMIRLFPNGKSNLASKMVVAARSTGEGRVVLTLGDSQYVSESVTEFADVDQWFFIAITYDGSQTSENVKVYASTAGGEVRLAQSGRIETGDWDPSAPGKMEISIGNNSTENRPFLGQIDDLRIYSGALGAGEIEAVRAAALTRSGKN